MTEQTEFLKLKEVATRLRVSRRKVADLIGQGELEVIKVSPRNWLVPAGDVDTFLKRKRSKAEPTAAA